MNRGGPARFSGDPGGDFEIFILTKIQDLACLLRIYIFCPFIHPGAEFWRVQNHP